VGLPPAQPARSPRSLSRSCSQPASPAQQRAPSRPPPASNPRPNRRTAVPQGATNVDLEGVFHSPLGEKLSIFGPWYGSDEVSEEGGRGGGGEGGGGSDDWGELAHGVRAWRRCRCLGLLIRSSIWSRAATRALLRGGMHGARPQVLPRWVHHLTGEEPGPEAAAPVAAAGAEVVRP
jgi:hypothetical protein